MKYSLDRIHKPDPIRGGGFTVSALCSAIGNLMVTENMIVPYVVPYLSYWPHIRKEFFQLVENHFNEHPETKMRYELSIKGYSSRIVMISEDMYDMGYCSGRMATDPIFDMA